jgi:hypothetical protein
MHVLMSKAVDLFRANINYTHFSKQICFGIHQPHAVSYEEEDTCVSVHICTHTSTPECLHQKRHSATDLLRSLRVRMFVPGTSSRSQVNIYYSGSLTLALSWTVSALYVWRGRKNIVV